MDPYCDQVHCINACKRGKSNFNTYSSWLLFDLIWFDLIRFDLFNSIWFDSIQFNSIRFDSIQFDDFIWFDSMVSFDSIRFNDFIWFDLIRFNFYLIRFGSFIQFNFHLTHLLVLLSDCVAKSTDAGYWSSVQNFSWWNRFLHLQPMSSQSLVLAQVSWPRSALWSWYLHPDWLDCLDCRAISLWLIPRHYNFSCGWFAWSSPPGWWEGWSWQRLPWWAADNWSTKWWDGPYVWKEEACTCQAWNL